VSCADPLLGHPELTPFNQVWWHLRKGYYFPLIGQYQAGRDMLDRAAALSDMYGLQGLRRTFLLIASYQISCFAMLGDIRSARKWHERMIAMATPERPDAWHVTNRGCIWVRVNILPWSWRSPATELARGGRNALHRNSGGARSGGTSRAGRLDLWTTHCRDCGG
jgi:hypothetical protein